MALNCEFCNSPLTFSNKESDQAVEVYDCKNCKVLTCFYFDAPPFSNDRTRIKIGFFVDIGSKLYYWINNYVDNSSTLFEVSFDAIKKGKDGLLIKFPKIMNINPDNVQERIAFYLPFI